MTTEHECETPVDGAIQHRWACKKCGQVWEVVGFYVNGDSEYEPICRICGGSGRCPNGICACMIEF
jgi:hypothetical protein